MDIFKIIFLALLANNVVFTQFIGVRLLLGQVREISSAIRIGIAIMFILTIVNIISFCIYQYILNPLQIQFLQTLAFMIVIISLLSVASRIVKKIKNNLFQNIACDIPMITTNSIILGVCLLAFKNDAAVGLLQIIIYTISAAAGYMLVMIIMAGIEEHTRLTTIPKGMKGFPISLITIGIIALAFWGLTGIIK